MIPSYIYSNLLTYDKCAYQQMLLERKQELYQFQQAISSELEALEMELQVLSWRDSATTMVTKKITLYEDFFKKLRKAPRQDKKVEVDILTEAKRALELL